MTRCSRRISRVAPVPLLAFLLLAPAGRAQAPRSFDRLDAALPGPLLSATTVRLPDGSTGLAALVGPPLPEEEEEKNPNPGDEDRKDEDERPGSLVLIDPTTGHVVPLAHDLPPGSRTLAAVGRGGGAGELLVVATEEGLLPVDPSGNAPATPVEPSLAGTLLRGDGLAADPSGLLALVRPGELALWTGTPEGRLETAELFPLPKRAERKRWGVRITSPAVHRVDDRSTPDAPTCWAIGPEAHGKRRLRTLLYCSGEPEPVEAWSLLPTAETVTEVRFVRHGERPLLLVLTRDKLGPFVEQTLRVYKLEASRNRVGADPLLAAETGCPLWRDSTLGFADADGDGRDDLYLVCEKGLIDQELRVEVYRYLGGGRFEDRPRDLNVEGEHSSWVYGRDRTGDGLPDLLAVREGVLELYPGTDARRRPVERRPETSLDLSTGRAGEDPETRVEVEVTTGPDGGENVTVRLGGPRILDVLDLTGDGRDEIVIYRTGRPGGLITVLSPR